VGHGYPIILEFFPATFSHHCDNPTFAFDLSQFLLVPFPFLGVFRSVPLLHVSLCGFFLTGTPDSAALLRLFLFFFGFPGRRLFIGFPCFPHVSLFDWTFFRFFPARRVRYAIFSDDLATHVRNNSFPDTVPPFFLKNLSALCDAFGIPPFFSEVQSFVECFLHFGPFFHLRHSPRRGSRSLRFCLCLWIFFFARSPFPCPPRSILFFLFPPLPPVTPHVPLLLRLVPFLKFCKCFSPFPLLLPSPFPPPRAFFSSSERFPTELTCFSPLFLGAFGRGPSATVPLFFSNWPLLPAMTLLSSRSPGFCILTAGPFDACPPPIFYGHTRQVPGQVFKSQTISPGLSYSTALTISQPTSVEAHFCPTSSHTGRVFLLVQQTWPSPQPCDGYQVLRVFISCVTGFSVLRRGLWQTLPFVQKTLSFPRSFPFSLITFQNFETFPLDFSFPSLHGTVFLSFFFFLPFFSEKFFFCPGPSLLLRFFSFVPRVFF